MTAGVTAKVDFRESCETIPEEEKKWQDEIMEEKQDHSVAESILVKAKKDGKKTALGSRKIRNYIKNYSSDNYSTNSCDTISCVRSLLRPLARKDKAWRHMSFNCKTTCPKSNFLRHHFRRRNEKHRPRT